MPLSSYSGLNYRNASQSTRSHNSRVASLLLAISISLGCATGCKVGPDFQIPKPPPLNPEFAEAEPIETATFEQLTYWWAGLNDPALNSLIAEACRQNLDLREAYHRVAVARAELGVVRADRLPQADAVAGYAWRDFAENASQFISTSAGNRGFSFHRLGFDTRWEVDLFGKIARAIESVQANLDAEIETYRAVKVSLLAEVATTYVELRLSQERLQIAERNLAAQRETLRIVQEREKSGLVSPLDVAQAESNVYRTAANIPELRQLERISINQLAVLLARTPDAVFIERLVPGTSPQLPDYLGVGVPADLLSRRPDVRAAQRQVASASALVGSAIAEKYPQVSVFGTISVGARDIDMLFTDGSLAHSVGPSLRWNILNFHQLNNLISRQSAKFRVAIVNYQRTVLTAVQEVEDGLVAMHRQGERAYELSRAVDATQRAVASSEVRYERGLIGFQPVLDSQRELLSAEDAWAISRAETLLGLIRVYKALGGGWNSRCACEVAAEGVDPEVISPGEQLDPELELPEPSGFEDTSPSPSIEPASEMPSVDTADELATTIDARSIGSVVRTENSIVGPPVLAPPHYLSVPVTAQAPVRTHYLR